MSENLFYLSSFLGIVVFIIYLLKIKTISFQTTSFVPFIWLLFFSTLYELVLDKWLNVGSIIWFRTYGILEFYALYYYFYRLVRDYRYFFKFIFVLYLVLFVLFLFKWKLINPLQVDSYLITIELILVFISSILWFIQLLKILLILHCILYLIFI